MNEHCQNEKIALYCGWKFDKNQYKQWINPDGTSWNYPPAYNKDLNQMHNAEKSLEDKDENGRLMAEYATWKLPSVCEIYSRKNELVHPYAGSIGNYLLIHATAAQRAEAFLKTIGKWEE